MTLQRSRARLFSVLGQHGHELLLDDALYCIFNVPFAGCVRRKRSAAMDIASPQQQLNHAQSHEA